MQEKYLKNIPFEEVLELKNLVNYAEGRVSSKTLVQRNDLSITLFAFDQGEGLSTHSAPGDAMVYVMEGSVNVTIGEDTKVVLKEGQTAVMPANIPHALESIEKFKMLLTVVKPQKENK
ncbi:MAG: cupin domain-containing protein [Marinisporobacter sp.]|jgi:quercetin dioxygenase-like cupin family protein|uniref:cupin domain-containing protein n=1 Tax=Crassaminicella profunda TaxID=1286698 RepID=UPI001CA6EF12|nr:cupin domain-containing protein [Crassaminicella profunda]MCT4618306.1 cupin domain-containing protein [Marinisporobacter sp.]QZY53961.1 cupin domain-containing protein [Crassaminicella profunda]